MTLNRVTVRLRLDDDGGLVSEKPVRTPEDAFALLSAEMKTLDREMVVLLNLNNRMQPINFHVLSIGGISNAYIPLESVFTSAILSSATAVMLAHNHPSGSTIVSAEDLRITERLCKAGEILHIPVVDHIIIAGQTGQCISIREQNPDIFKGDSLSELMAAEEVQEPGALQKVMQQLQTGVQNIFESEKYRQFLTTMAKFHRYSPNNCLLIHLQRPDSSGLVAGYAAWQKKFHRHVRKGEKGIQIIVPMPVKTFRKNTDIYTDENSKDGKKEDAEATEVILPRFGMATVFDVSQTDGAPLPTLDPKDLVGKVAMYDDMMTILRNISPVPIRFDNIPGSARGYYSSAEKEIVIQHDMPEAQTIKTMIHEIAHSIVHNREAMHRTVETKDAPTRETEAESIAYVVISHLGIGIDSGEYSFPYIAGWSAGKELKVLQNSLDTIQKTADRIIQTVDAELQKIDRVEIYQIDASGDYRDRIFRSYEDLSADSISVSSDAYERVHVARYQGETLDEIYERYNLNHPADFHGHSLSVSDVIMITASGVSTAYYVNSFGFREIPHFNDVPEIDHKQYKTKDRQR